MDIKVRKATPADLEQLVSFAVAEANDAEGISKAHERVREGIKKAMQDESIAIYWVLERGNAELIGNVSVFIGGAGSISGAIVGAIFLRVIQEILRVRVPQPWIPDLTILLFGAILIAVIMFSPSGLVGLGQREDRSDLRGLRQDSQ